MTETVGDGAAIGGLASELPCKIAPDFELCHKNVQLRLGSQ